MAGFTFSDFEGRADGRVYVNDASTVRVWDDTGGTWAGLAGAGFGGGVSDSCANSFDPGLIRVGTATCVAWTELAASGQQVVLRCAN